MLLLICGACARAAGAVPVEIARDGRPLLDVVIGENASNGTKAVAAELAAYLGRMSGGAFKVTTGDGSGGIVLGRSAEFARLPFAAPTFGAGPRDREDYLLRSTDKGLYLLGATDLAVSHAAWDLLHRLGYRQFFPGATWEVVPPPGDLNIAVDERQSPSFNARRIWYNWGLWGYNNEPYKRWGERNRMAKGLDLNSGHSYEGIIRENKAAFDAHPEYYALVNGRRELRGDVKFCVSNAGLRQLVVDHAVRTIKANPKLDSVSMDPSDGGGWCECDECKKFPRISDRVVTLANAVAEAINAAGLGEKYVGIYAYNQHSAPPTIRVHANVIPSATTAFIGGGYSFNQVVTGWQAQGATMGVYDYLSVVDWDWNLPRGGTGSRLTHVAGLLPDIHKKGVRFYDAESGDCWGPCGLGYYFASRVLWDVGEAAKKGAIVEDFLGKSFGEAREPMREFYRLITEDTQRRPPSDLLGRMYRQVEAARKATTDAKVLARLDDLTLYTRYAELYYAKAAGKGTVDDVARHAYRMRKTMMVHSYGLWARLLSQKAAHEPKHPLKNDEPFAPAELAKMLVDGIKNNVPVDPGFAGVEFGRNLVPAFERLKLPSVPAGRFPTAAQDQQRYAVWVAPGTTSVDLTVTVKKLWANRMPKVTLTSPAEVSLNAVASDDSYRPDGKANDIRLKTQHAGLHFVETVDGGDYTTVKFPPGMPVTVESGIDTPGVTSHFRGPWTMYAYVPKGTKVVGGWASRIANWAPRASGKLLTPDGATAIDFAKIEEGWFKADVPAGQDGKLWRFDNCQGQRLLMTVPPYLARSAEELLLPAEVVERDAAGR
jgi:hypothetical protein